jgi:hypothetical protein
MATWKRLTRSDGISVDLNLEKVAYMYRSGSSENQTTIALDFAQADKLCVVTVKQTPDHIHTLAPLSSR